MEGFNFLFFLHPAEKIIIGPNLTLVMFCIAGSGTCRFDWSFEGIERLFSSCERRLLPGKFTDSFF